MNYILTLGILLLLSSCSKSNYLNVPLYSESENKNLHVEFYNCVDCPKKYEDQVKNIIIIENNKFQWNPLSTNKIIDTVFFKTLNATINSIGYNSFISDSFYHSYLSSMIDSLIYHYNQDLDTNNYYQKFWKRRINDNSENIVFRIISDLNASFKNSEIIPNESYMSKKLQHELLIDKAMAFNSMENEKTFFLELFEYLKNCGQYSDAYVLLFQPKDFSKFGYDKTKLIKSLNQDSTYTKSNKTNDSIVTLGYFNKHGIWKDEYLFWKNYPGP